MEQAQKLKDVGNEYYKLHKFEEAIQKYLEASKLQPQEPVYYSNISAAQYEIGKYKECQQTIDHAFTLVSPSSNLSLYSRLLLRKAKSFFYLNQLEECYQLLSSNEKEAGLENNVEVSALKEACRSSKYASDFPTMSCFRQIPDTQLCDFTTIGHDNIFSFFEGQVSNEQEESLKHVKVNSREQHQQVLAKLQKEAPFRIKLENPSLSGEFSFLLGGVGDARHLFGSLLDLESVDFTKKIAPESGENSNSNSAKLKFHFSMVDIKEPVIARDLTMLYILLRFSKFNKREQQENIHALELLALAHYTYFCTTMPNYLYTILLDIIKELISDLKNKKLPPWIVINEASTNAVLIYLEDWLDVSADTKTMMRMINSELDDMMQKQVFNGQHENPPGIDDPNERLAKQAEKMSDQEILELPIPGNTSVEKRRNLRAILANSKNTAFLRESSILLPGIVTENQIFKEILTLLPPERLLSRHPELKALMADYPFYATQARRKTAKARSRDQLIKAAKKHVKETFKPNPTFWDEWFMHAVERDYEVSVSPSTAASSLFDMPMRQPKEATSIFDYSSIFFARVSNIVGKFHEGSGVVLEWVVGDVFDFCVEVAKKKEERRKEGMAFMFDRMYFSNVPDYTGGNLPIAAFCAPLLKPVPHSYISYRVLLNTPHFKDIEDNAKTYTLLPKLADHEKYLGMKFFHGELWGSDYPKWTVLNTPISTSKLASQEELANWLYKVFLHIVLPPEKSLMVKHRIDYPQNLIAFVFRLIEVGYPNHWIVVVLDSILDGKITTKARPPPNSMNDNSFATTTISTLPFIAELEYALAANLQYLPFRPSKNLPSAFQTVTFHPDPNPIDEQKAPVLTLLFAPLPELVRTKGRQCYIHTNLRSMIVDPDPSTLSLLSSVSLLSTLYWESEEGETEMRFCISKERIEKMVKDDIHVNMVRSDTSLPLLFHPSRVHDIIKV